MLNSNAGGKSSDKNCAGKTGIMLQAFSIQTNCEDDRDKYRMLQKTKMEYAGHEDLRVVSTYPCQNEDRMSAVGLT
jgi:hypothetical protein